MGRTYLCGILILIITSCSHRDIEIPVRQDTVPSQEQDFCIYHSDSTDVWLSGLQYKSLLTSQATDITPPEGYSVMTREEAKSYHMIEIPDDSGERYLCLNGNTWYSFRWNEGSVTKAGEKTKYSLCFIKVDSKYGSITITTTINYDSIREIP